MVQVHSAWLFLLRRTWQRKLLCWANAPAPALTAEGTPAQLNQLCGCASIMFQEPSGSVSFGARAQHQAGVPPARLGTMPSPFTCTAALKRYSEGGAMSMGRGKTRARAAERTPSR